MFKNIQTRACDICGSIKNVISRSFFDSMGYQASNTDPLAQKLKILHVKFDLCPGCLGLVRASVEKIPDKERNDILAVKVIRSMREN